MMNHTGNDVNLEHPWKYLKPVYHKHKGYHVWVMHTARGPIYNITDGQSKRPDSDNGYYELESLLKLKGIK